MDDSSVVKGHAYLSSSSAREFSQESDDIESSYFTNAMITGLRGAADTSGDNKVTLNELYSYAFNETLSKTESSKAGPQHPNYNITLVGSGDLILSDISNADAMLSISKEAKGTFIIRDSNGKLISEINKAAGLPILMALPVGTYTAVCINEFTTLQGTFSLEKNSVYMLDQSNLLAIQQKDNTLKGDLISTEESGEKEASDDKFTLGDPFHLEQASPAQHSPDSGRLRLGNQRKCKNHNNSWYLAHSSAFSSCRSLFYTVRQVFFPPGPYCKNYTVDTSCTADCPAVLPAH